MTVGVRIDLALLATFDPITDPHSLRKRLKSWKRCFETYIVALNLTKDKLKRAVSLYQVEQAMEKLGSYFNPNKNVAYEIFRFREAVQQSGETVDQFAT